VLGSHPSRSPTRPSSASTSSTARSSSTGGNHPEIVFRSTRVELAEDGGAAVDGELEIRGVARPVTATGTYQPPIEDPYGASRGAVELRTVVDRRDWGMNWQLALPAGGDALGYEVEVTVALELVKQG
jgi:polyisoprenoid-binding protein YceI